LKNSKDKDEFGRERATDALGRVGNSRAVPALRAALNDEDGDVRQAAEEALERIAAASKK